MNNTITSPFYNFKPMTLSYLYHRAKAKYISFNPLDHMVLNKIFENYDFTYDFNLEKNALNEDNIQLLKSKLSIQKAVDLLSTDNDYAFVLFRHMHDNTIHFLYTKQKDKLIVKEDLSYFSDKKGFIIKSNLSHEHYDEALESKKIDKEDEFIFFIEDTGSNKGNLEDIYKILLESLSSRAQSLALFLKDRYKLDESFVQKFISLENISSNNFFKLLDFIYKRAFLYHPNVLLLINALKDYRLFDENISVEDNFKRLISLKEHYDKELYTKEFEFFKELIFAHKVDKLVLFRDILLSNSSSLSSAFFKAIDKYKHAFIYYFSSSYNDIWFGASPEILASYNDNMLKTVALAGTQITQDIPLSDYNWSKKDRDEQQFVVNYIKNILNITENLKAYTHCAGPVVHLKTDICKRVNNKKEALDFAQRLNPTPAVCGLPKQIAYNIISFCNPRSYYAQCLGVLNSNSFNLYVNLRCAQKDIFNNTFAFCGGGIVEKSQLEQEYQESINKLKTIKDLL